MTYGYLILILGAIALFALLSRKIEHSVLTMPILFTLLGLAIGEGGLAWLPASSHESTIHLLSEVTLTLLLFSDASTITLKPLLQNGSIALRLLLIGLPLTLLFGTLVAHWLTPSLSYPLAFLVAALLTPTDMILSQSVLTHKGISQTLRQSLNTESGLNDGLVLPFVLLAAYLATGTQTEESFAGFTLRQIILGPLVGAAVGVASAKLLDMSIHRELSQKVYRGIYFLATAFLAYLLAESIEGNGSMAAFSAGLFFGNTVQCAKSFITEFMEAEGQLLAMITFLIFGAVMVPQGLHYADIYTVLMALFFLSVVRIIPVFIALGGTKLQSKEKLFVGWFGPRGLASILFALLVAKGYNVPHIESVMACVVLTVLLSILLHGASTWPILSRLSGNKESI